MAVWLRHFPLSLTCFFFNRNFSRKKRWRNLYSNIKKQSWKLYNLTSVKPDPAYQYIFFSFEIKIAKCDEYSWCKKIFFYTTCDLTFKNSSPMLKPHYDINFQIKRIRKRWTFNYFSSEGLMSVFNSIILPPQLC